MFLNLFVCFFCSFFQSETKYFLHKNVNTVMFEQYQEFILFQEVFSKVSYSFINMFCFSLFPVCPPDVPTAFLLRCPDLPDLPELPAPPPPPPAAAWGPPFLAAAGLSCFGVCRSSCWRSRCRSLECLGSPPPSAGSPAQPPLDLHGSRGQEEKVDDVSDTLLKQEFMIKLHPQ